MATVKVSGRIGGIQTGEGNMTDGISVEVEVPKLVISGFGNGSNTENYRSISDYKGNTLRNEDGKAIHVINSYE